MADTPATVAAQFLTANLGAVGATKNLTNQIVTAASGTDSERSLTYASQAVVSLQNQINLLLGYIKSIQFLLSSSSSSGADTGTVTINGVTVTY